MLWLPSYLYSKTNKLGALDVSSLFLVSAHVVLFAVISYSMAMTTVFIDYQFLLLLFHVVSAFCPVLPYISSTFFSNLSKSFSKGSFAAQTIYNISTGVLGIWWIKIFSDFMQPYFIAHGIKAFYIVTKNVLGMRNSSSYNDQAGFWFLIDFVFLWTSISVWVLFECGLAVFLQTNLWMLFIGPGAAFSRAASIREEFLLNKDAAGAQKVHKIE
jgi:hypothetical protein